MAHAIVYRTNGGPEVLEYVEIEDATPGEGQIVVAVRAAGVNPIDWKLRSGMRPAPTDGSARRIGSDAAGVVTAVGAGVDGHAVGDEVIVLSAAGAYATEIVAKAGPKTFAKPAELDWTHAAALGIPTGTAYQAVASLGVAEGDTLLLHGGAGAVGQAAIQFAVRAGATVIATASERNHERLTALGAIPVAYGDGLADRVRAAAPQGVTHALDAVGTDEAIEVSLDLVADREHIATIVRGADAPGWGIRAWSGGSAIPLTEEENALRLAGVVLAAQLAAEGGFDVEIARTYPLAEAAEAHRESEAGHVRGKLVLLP
ncbi:NADP-dependent oxidoreductase [Schumannella luteola]|uniref:Enoyl reductase n=1 Tax=Schumannella luteola TaxID=472059 RepID=A0A852YD91_9MICO|nr:NADP-dependent oxidoreductase [Schumannella luteola]NYG97597.1 enoyl reductase [Schumannella luteola]TPW90765.1 NADP-dependent oxidoreductase [Schumannella luteola]